ncbi:hypothetical protein GTY86_33765 [Streptomyces sp. SID5770]|uniref:hypothetical protein n=1 Tax=Streptomyces sp. SID5770 TaxID=2690308 RepID=UPI001369538D|nr:hypothetical protein [Streptomyces sp. SID5770]MZE56153.1 hypothetical protein [Streptomyces sp. SID5770]
MIPATTPYVARYRKTFKHADGTEGAYLDEVPVIAWDDEGEALIAAPSRGRLVLANGTPNFDSIALADPHVVAVLPATGWLAQYKDDNDGGTFDLPVVAFLVESDGSCKPIRVDSDGFTDDARESENFIQLIDPGQKEVT